MFCRCCGEPIDKYDKFCIHCGQRVIPLVQNTTANIPTYTGQNNAKETRWALVIGIIALIVAFIHPVAGLVLGIIAIVRSGKEHQKAALILGIIALVICGFRFFNGLFILRYIEDIFFEFYCF